jgi:pimeloyl-ACP methyl ester carboxylesterase
MRCPSLLVRAAAGDGRDVYRRMLREQPLARLAELPDAGHDVHLDRPDLWREQLTAFLGHLPSSEA